MSISSASRRCSRARSARNSDQPITRSDTPSKTPCSSAASVSLPAGSAHVLPGRARVLVPAVVEPFDRALRVGNPGQLRDRVGQLLQAHLAGTQLALGNESLGDVLVDEHHLRDAAVRRLDRTRGGFDPAGAGRLSDLRRVVLDRRDPHGLAGERAPQTRREALRLELGIGQHVVGGVGWVTAGLCPCTRCGEVRIRVFLQPAPRLRDPRGGAICSSDRPSAATAYRHAMAAATTTSAAPTA